ncbi:MAG: hypothetical protein OEZ33_07235 [Gammaproteobacteria bacterium]|nr:hypothetical protein [Gammaproteobacteria bacterium]
MIKFDVKSGTLLHLQFISGNHCYRGTVRLLETIPNQFIIVSKPKAEDFLKGEIEQHDFSDPQETLVWYTDKLFLYSFKAQRYLAEDNKKFSLQLVYPELIKKIELSRLDAIIKEGDTEELPYTKTFILDALNDRPVSAVA